jgi:hypothetical protein
MSGLLKSLRHNARDGAANKTPNPSNLEREHVHG